MKRSFLVVFAFAAVSFAQSTGLLNSPLSEQEWNAYPEFSTDVLGSKSSAARASIFSSKNDIRDMVGSTYVADQGACSSCVSNSLMTQAEYRLRHSLIFKEQLPVSAYPFKFSVNQILNCLNLQCVGHNWSEVTNTLKNTQTKFILGSPSENQHDWYSYGCNTSTESYARLGSYTESSSLGDYVPWFKVTAPSGVKSAISHGYAVGASICTQGTDFNRYSELATTMNPSCSIIDGPTDHSIVIVGYDDNLDGGVWIVQNSWGAGAHNGGKGFIKVKYGALNMRFFRIMNDLVYTRGLVDDIKSGWCNQSTNRYAQSAFGYTSKTLISSNKMRSMGSAGFTSASGKVASKKDQGHYVVNTYRVEKLLEIPLNAVVENNPSQTFGVSAAFGSAADLNKQPYSTLVVNTEIVGGITRNVAKFTTYVLEIVANTNGQPQPGGYWPGPPDAVEFAYFIQGAGACSNVLSAPSISAKPISNLTKAYSVVSFNVANSGGTPTDWAWQFGDGETSTLQYPMHRYRKPGIYYASVQASNRFGLSNSLPMKIEVQASYPEFFALSFY